MNLPLEALGLRRLSRLSALLVMVISGASCARASSPSVARLIPTGAGEERCGLPTQTDVEQAVVVVRVMVLPDGTPQHVEIVRSSTSDAWVRDAAEECALKYDYRPARDESGRARRGWTHDFNITFSEAGAPIFYDTNPVRTRPRR